MTTKLRQKLYSTVIDAGNEVEHYIAAVIAFTLSISTMRREDLLSQLAKSASQLSDMAISKNTKQSTIPSNN